ncbi:hypothetical protein GCM10010176_066350 [Nonomuraea spiralis]|nr:hypothetical protein GCM10010176_066350 [Nonomuraea spiralis]
MIRPEARRRIVGRLREPDTEMTVSVLARAGVAYDLAGSEPIVGAWPALADVWPKSPGGHVGDRICVEIRRQAVLDDTSC